MKTRMLVLLAALSAIALTPAHAISVTWNEESGVRHRFTVIWGELAFAPLSFVDNGATSDAGAMDLGGSVSVDLVSAFQPGNPADLTPYFDGFDITFSGGSRLFSSAVVSGFGGASVTALSGEPYGAEVVYGTPLPGDGGPTVSDASSSLLLLVIGLGALLAWQRTSLLSNRTPRARRL